MDRKKYPCDHTDDWYNNVCNLIKYGELKDQKCNSFDPDEYYPTTEDIVAMSNDDLYAIARQLHVPLNDRLTVMRDVFYWTMPDKLEQYIKEYSAYVSLFSKCTRRREKHYQTCKDDPFFQQDKAASDRHDNARLQLSLFSAECREMFDDAVNMLNILQTERALKMEKSEKVNQEMADMRAERQTRKKADKARKDEEQFLLLSEQDRRSETERRRIEGLKSREARKAEEMEHRAFLKQLAIDNKIEAEKEQVKRRERLRLLEPFRGAYENALGFKLTDVYLKELELAIQHVYEGKEDIVLNPPLHLVPWATLTSDDVNALANTITNALQPNVYPTLVATMFHSLYLFADTFQIETSSLLREYIPKREVDRFVNFFLNAYIKRANKEQNINWNYDLLSQIVGLLTRQDADAQVAILAKNARSYPRFRPLYEGVIDHISAFMMHFAAHYSNAIYSYYLDNGDMSVEVVEDPLRQAVQRYDRYVKGQDVRSKFEWTIGNDKKRIWPIWDESIEGGKRMRDIKQMTKSY